VKAKMPCSFYGIFNVTKVSTSNFVIQLAFSYEFNVFYISGIWINLFIKVFRFVYSYIAHHCRPGNGYVMYCDETGCK
jgi:hypothetical protein